MDKCLVLDISGTNNGVDKFMYTKKSRKIHIDKMFEC